jgi:hypothetical protein
MVIGRQDGLNRVERHAYRCRRRRYVAAAVAAASTPLLWISPAAAADHEVTFGGGGLGVLSCESRPDVSRVLVAPESTVDFTNQLGQPAMLRIDGADRSRVARGATVEVRFHRGPASVQLVPDCVLNLSESFSPVTVQVSPPRPEPTSADDPPPSGATSAPATSGRTDGSNQRPAAGAGTTDQVRPGPAGAPPARPAAGIPPGPEGAPSGAAEPGAAGPGAAGPGAAGPSVVDPDEWRTWYGVDGVGPGIDLPTGGPATVLDRGQPAEPMAYAAANSRTGSFGLLALIATVCVVGITVGAIRAIVAQRATRTSWA